VQSHLSTFLARVGMAGTVMLRPAPASGATRPG
jgi:hypothetical protein